jgi:hypothetical protein
MGLLPFCYPIERHAIERTGTAALRWQIVRARSPSAKPSAFLLWSSLS